MAEGNRAVISLRLHSPNSVRYVPWEMNCSGPIVYIGCYV